MGQIWNFGVQLIARFRSLILHAICNGFRGEASRHGKKPLNQRYPGTCGESQCQQEQKLSVAIGLQSGAVRSLPTPTCCGSLPAYLLRGEQYEEAVERSRVIQRS